jgi:hypothetical protein
VDANSAQWVAATSDPVNIGVVASQSERDAQYPTPGQGMRVYRTDLGVTQTYYGLFNASTNPGGRDAAGWYDTEKSAGLVPMRPSSIIPVTGTGSVDSIGKVSFSGCPLIEMRDVFTTQYQNYVVELSGIKTATAAANVLWTRLATNTSVQVSDYQGGFNGVESGFTTQTNYYDGTLMALTYANANGNPFASTIHLYSPMVAAQTLWHQNSMGYAPGNTRYFSWGGGLHNVTSTYPSFQLGVTGGGLITGSIQIFGYND